MRCSPLLVLASLALISTPVPGQGHDEAVDGDLSGNPGAPTPVVFVPGSNIVKGTCTDPTDTRDYLTFTIPDGGSLSALVLLEYIDVPSGDNGDIGYHAINAGPTSVIPSNGTMNAFLGGSHTASFPPPWDLLPALSLAQSNGTGFSLPLGPGTYSYVMQQTAIEVIGYTYDFVLDDSWTDEDCALAGVNGDPQLDASGFLVPGELNTLALSNAAPNAATGLFVALAGGSVAFKGGTLKPFPFLIEPVSLPTNAAGSVTLPFLTPAGLPPGTELWMQWAIQDAAAIKNVSLSNAVKGTAG